MKTINLTTIAGESFDFPAIHYTVDDLRRIDPHSHRTVDGVDYAAIASRPLPKVLDCFEARFLRAKLELKRAG